jgi:hypothetical protein
MPTLASRTTGQPAQHYPAVTRPAGNFAHGDRDRRAVTRPACATWGAVLKTTTKGARNLKGFTHHIYTCRLDTRHVSTTLAGLEDQLSHPATT